MTKIPMGNPPLPQQQTHLLILAVAHRVAAPTAEIAAAAARVAVMTHRTMTVPQIVQAAKGRSHEREEKRSLCSPVSSSNMNPIKLSC